MNNQFETLYPHLFSETVWPWAPVRANFQRTDVAPPVELISNVNLVPSQGKHWCMIHLASGEWDVPGGTLEPGEHYLETLHREVMEEAGARILSAHLIGAWHCFSLVSQPYRPHLPHPEHFRLVFTGEIQVLAAPTNPTGARQVQAVETVPLSIAAERFQASGRRDLAELYQLANDLTAP